MDFNQVQISRPQFQDLKKGLHTSHLYAEVVLIDKSPEGPKPRLFQLKKDQLTPFQSMDVLRQEFITLPHPAFILMGEVRDIDTSKKTIIMSNDNIVTYKFLIIVSGLDQTVELTTILHTLKDALMLEAMNVKEKIPMARNPYTRFGLASKKQGHSFSVPSQAIAPQFKYIEQIVQPKIVDTDPQTLLFNLNASSKKLCTLQM